MNPFEWEYTIQGLRRNQDPNQQTLDDSAMENASRAHNDWHTHYSRYAVDEPQNRVPGVNFGSLEPGVNFGSLEPGVNFGSLEPGVNFGSLELGPSSRAFYMKESEVEDPDGELFEMGNDDPELTRKRKELREIEEQIMCKKVAIALKTVKPIVQTSPAVPSNKHSDTHNSVTLKDRVNVILQRRHPVSFLSKVRSPEDGTSSSSLSEEALLRGHHPLKLRVKELMKQRCSDPCVLPTNRKIPNVSQLSPSQSVALPDKEENSINQGFQRFLSVLNKGVNMDLLSRIVNDDSEDLPVGAQLLSIQPTAMESRSEPFFRCESQRSNSGASLQGNSRTNSEERRTALPRRERCLGDHLPDNGEKKTDIRAAGFGSTSGSVSPPAVKKEEEVVEKTMVDQKHEQLQNVLKTLGLSLEVEEMSKLTNRTQERLYGKKHEDVSIDGREKRERKQRSSHRSRSSSSSSCSSSSRSTSRSIGSSLSHHCRSHNVDSRPRQTFEHSGSRDRSREGPARQDINQSSKEGSKCVDRDRDVKDTYQHPYPQDQTHAHLHPATFASFPGYALPESSQYNVHHSESYIDATNFYWAYTQGAIPPSLYPREHLCSQNTHHNPPAAVVAPKMLYPHQKHFKDTNLLLNPDLSESEGQIGSMSRPRCLQVIRVKQANCLKQLTKPRRRRGGVRKREKKRFRLFRKKRKAAANRKKAQTEARAPQEDGDGRDPEVRKESAEERPPAEQEIKANFRKKLEAFNQKVKQKVTQPDNSVPVPTD